MRSLWMVAVLVVAVVAVGCRAPGLKPAAAAPGVAGAPTGTARVVETPLKTQLSRLERSLADARREQERIDRDVQTVRQRMFDAAKGLRSIKERADALAGELATNRLAIAVIEERIAQVKAPQDGGAAAPEADALRAVLEKERQQRQRDQQLASEREREIKDLRAALDARDEQLRRTAAPAAGTPRPSAAAPAATGTVYRMVVDGNAALRDGDIARAHGLFTAAMKQDATLTSARLGLAACAYQTGDLKEARRLVDDVLRDDRASAQAYGLRGIIAWHEGHVSSAGEDCAKAVELDPADPMLRKFNGIVLHARKRQADAIREMRKALELDPYDAEAKLNLAILLATDRKPALAEARLLYEQALAGGAARDAALDRILYETTAKP